MHDHDTLASAPNGHDLGPRARRRSSATLEPPSDLRRKQLPHIKTSIEATGLHFSCPYSKRSPTEPPKQRSCVYPGFPNIHRLKEHLYRYHKLSEFHCPRCYTRFDDKAELESHQRSIIPCELGEARGRDYGDGFDNEQEKELKKRVRSKSDEEKWTDIYKTLFPGDEKMPGPYCPSSPQSDLDDFRTFCHQQSPHILQHKLTSLLPSDQRHLHTSLLALVHDMHDQLFDDFQTHLEQSSSASSPSSATTSRSATPATPYSFSFSPAPVTPYTFSPSPDPAPSPKRPRLQIPDPIQDSDTLMTTPEILISPAPSPAGAMVLDSSLWPIDDDAFGGAAGFEFSFGGGGWG